MSKARLEWLERVAVMDRAELVEAYEKAGDQAHASTQNAARLDQEVKRLKIENSKLKNIREGRKTFIAESIGAAAHAARFMALNPNRVTLVATDSSDDHKLRGVRLDPEDVYFVRGWRRGRYAGRIISALAPCLVRADGTPVGTDCIAYAPDPHFQMHEDDGWESATRALEAKREAGRRPPDYDISLFSL